MAKLTAGEAISVINCEGVTEAGYTIVNPKPDKQGLIAISKDGITIPVHPKRIITGDFTEVRVTPDKENNMSNVTTEAPKEPTTQTAEQPTEAPKACKVEAPKPPKAPKPEPAPQVKVSLDDLAKAGELWVKGGVNFDHDVAVCACVLMFPAQGKYLSFNMYGGTFGKKGIIPPYAQILAGTDTGLPNIYLIKDIDKLRDKQAKNGYKKYGT